MSDQMLFHVMDEFDQIDSDGNPKPGIEDYTRQVLGAVDRAIEIADDVKKDFAYDKSTGKWAWYDRDEADNPVAFHGQFDSFCDALFDAVEPYLEPDEDG